MLTNRSPLHSKQWKKFWLHECSFLILYLFYFTTGAVRMNPLWSNASGADIGCQIKDWLKFATERDGGRTMQAEKRHQYSTTQSES